MTAPVRRFRNVNPLFNASSSSSTPASITMDYPSKMLEELKELCEQEGRVAPQNRAANKRAGEAREKWVTLVEWGRYFVKVAYAPGLYYSLGRYPGTSAGLRLANTMSLLAQRLVFGQGVADVTDLTGIVTSASLHGAEMGCRGAAYVPIACAKCDAENDAKVSLPHPSHLFGISHSKNGALLRTLVFARGVAKCRAL